MRNPIIILFLVFLCGQLGAQTVTIRVPGYFSDTTGAPYEQYQWIVNGRKLSKKYPTKIRTHYPLVDTIVFISDREKEKIITRFRPGHKYMLSIGCCAEGFDIYDEKPSEYTKLYDSISETQFDSMRIAEENPPVDFKVINYDGKDTLIGIYSDLFGCMGVGFMLKKDLYRKNIEPAKSYMADNRNYLIVATRTDTILPEVEENGWFKIDPDKDFVFWCQSIQTIAEVQVRFMYHEHMLVIYDAKKKKLKIQVKD